MRAFYRCLFLPQTLLTSVGLTCYGHQSSILIATWELGLQAQYLSNGEEGTGEWVLPLTYCVGSYKRMVSELVRQKASVLSLPFKDYSQDNTKAEVTTKGKYEVKIAEELVPKESDANGNETDPATNDVDLSMEWVKFNVGQTGFYRVQYDEELAARLRSAITKGILEATDRFGKCAFPPLCI